MEYPKLHQSMKLNFKSLCKDKKLLFFSIVRRFRRRHFDTTATPYLCFTVLVLDKHKLIYHINFHHGSKNDERKLRLSQTF